VSEIEILELIDYRLANLDKANDHLKWCYETDPTKENWGNYQNIGGAWSELVELREEIINLLNNEEAGKFENNTCEICEENPKENPEGKWCTSCKDDYKESNND
jgi:hypothetical protein